jgi:hypothetical protein
VSWRVLTQRVFVRVIRVVQSRLCSWSIVWVRALFALTRPGWCSDHGTKVAMLCNL